MAQAIGPHSLVYFTGPDLEKGVADQISDFGLYFLRQAIGQQVEVSTAGPVDKYVLQPSNSFPVQALCLIMAFTLWILFTVVGGIAFLFTEDNGFEGPEGWQLVETLNTAPTPDAIQKAFDHHHQIRDWLIMTKTDLLMQSDLACEWVAKYGSQNQFEKLVKAFNDADASVAAHYAHFVMHISTLDEARRIKDHPPIPALLDRAAGIILALKPANGAHIIPLACQNSPEFLKQHVEDIVQKEFINKSVAAVGQFAYLFESIKDDEKLVISLIDATLDYVGPLPVSAALTRDLEPLFSKYIAPRAVAREDLWGNPILDKMCTVFLKHDPSQLGLMYQADEPAENEDTILAHLLTSIASDKAQGARCKDVLLQKVLSIVNTVDAVRALIAKMPKATAVIKQHSEQISSNTPGMQMKLGMFHHICEEISDKIEDL